MRNPVLSFYLKAPVSGRVKTRLAAKIGDDAALGAYRVMVERVWNRLARLYPCVVFHTPDSAGEAMRGWLGDQATCRPQGEGDLGERLERGTARLFREDGGPVIILGGDCPYIDRFHIEATLDALRHVDLVIAPAHDGGYTLMGLRKMEPAVFRDIHWGSATVLEETLRHARRSGLSVKSLEPMDDVDDLESWLRAQKSLGLRER